jgi:MinD-like ATPase involved in chromosome partitioning or flagellar assembly
MSLRERLAKRLGMAAAKGETTPQVAPQPARRSSFGRVEVMGAGRWHPTLGRSAPRIIAVGGGKSGVGKSSVASNLAIALAGLGRQVVLVDLDLEAPQLHRLFGIERPVPGLQALLNNEIKNLDVSHTATGIRNLHLVAGGDGQHGRLPLDITQKRFLLRQIHELESEIIVVDVGTENRGDLLDFFALGALRLLVTTPDIASLESAYAFLKSAAVRAVAHYGGEAQQALAGFGGRLVGNQAKNAAEAERFHAFSRLVGDFLGIRLPVLGCLMASARLGQAGPQRPLLARRGVDENVRLFHRMAESIVTEDVATSRACDLADATAVSVAEGPLPASLESYMRGHSRHNVDWIATIDVGGRRTAARVTDISLTGAALEVVPGLTVGDRGTLRLEQLPGQPAIDIVVKNLIPALRRAGVAFLASDDLPTHLVAAATSRV